MKKNWLGLILGVSVCAVVVFGEAYSSLSADDFYVIAGGNRNVKTDATNTAIGVDALKYNTSGVYNTACGASALKNTTGSYNTASGSWALSSNTSGEQNTASGSLALHYNTTGGVNTAVGDHALFNNTTGSSNTASGSWALVENTTASGNVAVGSGALYLQSYDNNNNYWYSYNTAVGHNALFSNQPTSTTTGIQNTALGRAALYNNTTGWYNTASGCQSLYSNTTGGNNAAFGIRALYKGNGSHNTAIGPWALYNNTTGWDNVALGLNAGFNGNVSDNFTGTNNVYIGTDARPASLDESNTIRIGSSNNPQSHTFIVGIAGTNIGSGSYVFVNSSGQLGVIASSRRYKEDIKDMGEASAGLMQLRPVTFHYKPQYANGEHNLQYGLIAEEVAKVYPNIVQYDKTGKPQTVHYHLINAMLLNEFQKQERQIQAQEKKLKTLHATVAALKEQQRLSAAQNQELMARLAQLEGQVKKVATGSETVSLHNVQLSKLKLP